MNSVKHDPAKIIDDLKASPIFNMSLSSKELFHSNFLAWIFEQYPEICFKLIEIEKPHDFSKELFKINREEDNIDLKIKYDNELLAIIENKVKSLPNLEQLINYSKKSSIQSSKNRILLSLYETDNQFKDDLVLATNSDSNWSFISYQNIIELLSSNLCHIEDKHKFYVTDYIAFVKNLVELAKIWSNPELSDIGILSFNNYMATDELSDIRLHDIAAKIKSSVIQKYLHQKISKVITGDKSIWWLKSDDKDYPFNTFSINTLYSNRNAIIDYKMVVHIDKYNSIYYKNSEVYNNTVFFGIQIQGKQFRIVIETRDKKYKALDLCNHSKIGPKLWLPYIKDIDFSSITDDEILNGNNRKRYENERFGKFNEVFRYKYYNIKDGATINDIVTIIINIHNALSSLKGNKDLEEAFEETTKNWQ